MFSLLSFPQHLFQRCYFYIRRNRMKWQQSDRVKMLALDHFDKRYNTLSIICSSKVWNSERIYLTNGRN